MVIIFAFQMPTCTNHYTMGAHVKAEDDDATLALNALMDRDRRGP